MARTSDVVSCALAVALPVLIMGEWRPVAKTFSDDKGRLDVAKLLGVVTGQPPFEGKSLVTFALIGADKRKGDFGRSDTLLVMFVNPRSYRAALLSIPRDLRVSVPGHGYTKVNHAYAYGGPGLTQRTLQGLLGVRIDHYVVVFFDGFVHAVDALGGVRIEVPDIEGQGRGMNYDDNAGGFHVHLRPGVQHLDGRGALGFVRYRKSNIPGLGDGDVGRSRRQQELLKAIAEQHIRPASIVGLTAAVRVILRDVKTDMSAAEMVDLARVMRGCDTREVLTATVPLRPDRFRGHGVYYAYADETKLRTTMNRIWRHLQ